MSELLWHPIPGRLQSVSVADKAHIWGVTLDLQLARFNPKTRQWQLVSVMTEQANQNRYSAGSSHSTSTFGSGSVTGRASKTIAALLPSFGMGPSSGTASTSSSMYVGARSSTTSTGGSRPTSTSTSGAPSPAFDGSFLSSRTGEEDEDTDSTVQVSAAVDGTVVRLDKTLKAWYLIAPQSEEVDFGKDVIWIELGHFWKCVSVASISQIWGLSDCGDIYYGSSDRFVQLEAAVTSGAGYGQPHFTYISVGADNTVLATDAHSGIVFRLKKTDTATQPRSPHPPLWTALPGTGPRGLHIACCSLSTSEYIVGVTRDGRCYRFSSPRWIPLGGGAKLDSVGVGVDGYVIGVDRDGDLFGFQLERAVPARTMPKAIATEVKGDENNNSNSYSNKQEYEAMEMPRTPTQQKSFSRRPMASPRELFEMAVSDRGNGSERQALGGTAATTAAATAAIAAGRSAASHTPKASAYSRYTMTRSDSTASKRSYASDIGSGRTTPTGLNIQQPSSQEPPPQALEESSGASSSSGSLEMLSPFPKSPLRIHTKRTGGSYFEPQSDINHLKSPASGFPVAGNPYTTTHSQASSQNSRNPSPASSSQTPMASRSAIGSSSLSNDLTKELPSNTDHTNRQELSDSDDFMDLAKVQRIHAHALARKGEEHSQNNNHLGTGSGQQQQGDNTKPLTPPPEEPARSSDQGEGPIEKEVLSTSPKEPEKFRRDLFVITRFDTDQGINVIRDEGEGQDLQENHNVDTHLHTPPMTTPDEDKKQLFATSSGTDLWTGGEKSSSMDAGDVLGENHGRRDSLRVEMNLVELVAGEKHPVEYKRRPFRPSIDEGSAHSPHHFEQRSPQRSPPSSAPQPYSTFPSVPEKEKQHTIIPADLKHSQDRARYSQVLDVSSHRSSSSSDELMHQQQEFLRLARLRSESFAKDSTNGTSKPVTGKNEVIENVKEEAPFSPPLPSFSLTTRRTEFDPYSDHPLAYPGQHQYYQQEPNEARPFNSTSPLASPTTNRNFDKQTNMSIDPTMGSYIPPQAISSQQQEQLPLQERIEHLQLTQRPQPPLQSPPVPRPQPPIPAYIPPEQGRDIDKDAETEAASRPSYSSSHLQHYVDTTMVYQSGLASAERRQSQQLQLRQRSNGFPRQGGVQGEDAQGRWIGGADPSDVRQWNPDDVQKSKCCTIL